MYDGNLLGIYVWLCVGLFLCGLIQECRHGGLTWGGIFIVYAVTHVKNQWWLFWYVFIQLYISVLNILTYAQYFSMWSIQVYVFIESIFLQNFPRNQDAAHYTYHDILLSSFLCVCCLMVFVGEWSHGKFQGEEVWNFMTLVKSRIGLQLRGQ